MNYFKVSHQSMQIIDNCFTNKTNNYIAYLSVRIHWKTLASNTCSISISNTHCNTIKSVESQKRWVHVCKEDGEQQRTKYTCSRLPCSKLSHWQYFCPTDYIIVELLHYCTSLDPFMTRVSNPVPPTPRYSCLYL